MHSEDEIRQLEGCINSQTGSIARLKFALQIYQVRTELYKLALRDIKSDAESAIENQVLQSTALDELYRIRDKCQEALREGE